MLNGKIFANSGGPKVYRPNCAATSIRPADLCILVQIFRLHRGSRTTLSWCLGGKSRGWCLDGNWQLNWIGHLLQVETFSLHLLKAHILRPDVLSSDPIRKCQVIYGYMVYSNLLGWFLYLCDLFGWLPDSANRKLVVWIPGIPLWKGLLLSDLPLVEIWSFNWKPELVDFNLGLSFSEARSVKLSPDRSATTGHLKENVGETTGERLDTLVTDHGFSMGLYSRQVGSCSTHQLRSHKWGSCNVRRFVRRSQFPVKHCNSWLGWPSWCFNWDKSPLADVLSQCWGSWLPGRGSSTLNLCALYLYRADTSVYIMSNFYL